MFFIGGLSSLFIYGFLLGLDFGFLGMRRSYFVCFCSVFWKSFNFVLSKYRGKRDLFIFRLRDLLRG